MPLTFGQARKILGKYADKGGKCASSEEAYFFVMQVLQYLLYSGSYGNLRKFCFNAVKGCFTVPYELEAPLKVKIDGEIGSVWDKWFEWHSSSDLDDCLAAPEALYEEPNYFATVYDLPSGGARVGVLGTCNENVETAHVIVQGVDPSGREIFTKHEGEQISGEYLRIIKGEIRYTQVTFGKITNVVKAPTNGYVQLLWIKPDSQVKGFLSDYSPLETAPSYKRFRLKSRCAGLVKVSVIGRIRLKPQYTDMDYIPFDNVYALNLAGQTINSQLNNDVQIAQAKDGALQDIITRENEFKRVQNGQPLEFYQPISAGAIKNII